jgi:predicted transporter
MILKVSVICLANGAGFAFTSIVRADVVFLFLFCRKLETPHPRGLSSNGINFVRIYVKIDPVVLNLNFMNRHWGDVICCLWNERRIET